MKIYTKYTLPVSVVVASLALTSCGDRDTVNPTEGTSNSSVQAAQSNYEAQVKEALKPKIAAVTGDYLLATPAYLELVGPNYEIKQQDSGLIIAIVTWRWMSKSDLYNTRDFLETEEGEVTVLEKTSSSGEVASYAAKAVLIEQGGEVMIQRLSTAPTMDFEPSAECFEKLGFPKANIKNSVVVGSEEYLNTLQEAKALKDAKEEASRIAKQEEEARKRAEVKAKRDSMLQILEKEGRFSGNLIAQSRSNSVEQKFEFEVTQVSERAGDSHVSAALTQYYSNNKRTITAVFEGSFDENGTLVLVNSEPGKNSGWSTIWDLVDTSNTKLKVIPTGNDDKLKLTSKYGRFEISGVLVR